MDGRAGFDPIFVEDFPLPEGQLPPIRRFKWVAANYFETMGNPIVAGRTPTWSDIYNRSRVVLVTENFAREYWGDPTTAIGKRIGTGTAPGNWREIIGVVGDVRDDGVTQGPVAIVYWPMLLEDFWPEIRGDAPFVALTQFYAIRSPRVGTAGFLPEVKQAVWSFLPNRPLTNVQNLGNLLRGSMARTSFTLVMLGVAAAVALLLATVGVYGVISYVVSQRTAQAGARAGRHRGGAGARRRLRADAVDGEPPVWGEGARPTHLRHGRREPDRSGAAGQLSAGAARGARRSDGGAAGGVGTVRPKRFILARPGTCVASSLA
jgi:hypothetical protein